MDDLPQVIVPHPYDTLPAEKIIELSRQFAGEVVGKLLTNPVQS